jgi:two-component system sensor histidine kinase UhpB
VLNVLYEQDQEAVQEQLNACTRNPAHVAYWELRKVRKDGGMLWVKEAARAVKDADGKTVVLIVCKDISELKQGEDALRQSEQRFNLAASGASDGLWDWDILTDKVWRSPRFYELLGYEEGEIEATYAMFLELLHPQDKDETLEAVRAHLEDRVSYDVEIRLRTKSGGYRWFRSRAQALWDETGKPVRMAGSIQDITDRKRAEDALRASSRRLVEAQENERRHIARELHDEIGQVLTGLKLTLEMNARLPTCPIGDSLVEAAAVVNDIMGKVRELSLSLRPPMLDDFGLLHALLWHFQRYTARTNVQVTTSNLTNPTGLDRRRFPSDIETAAYRIVQEALTNIARHAKAPEARVSLWTDHSTLYVQIQDHGIGFDPESVQASRPCSGLAGIRERVALLNGCFTLESAPGAGTQLTAELPLGDSVDRGTEDGYDDNPVGG